MKWLDSFNRWKNISAIAINIITEEAAPYFAGQKNVNEVADIIQNRVQIYVNENR